MCVYVYVYISMYNVSPLVQFFAVFLLLYATVSAAKYCWSPTQLLAPAACQRNNIHAVYTHQKLTVSGVIKYLL